MKIKRLLALFMALTMALSVFGALTITTEAASMGDGTFFSKLNYSAYPGLSAVKAAVDRGDYAAAKTELLKYYRQRTIDGEVKAFDITEADANIGQANLARDFIITGPYEFDVWLDTVAVSSSAYDTYTAEGEEIVKYLKKELDNKSMSIMLFERQKQGVPIYVASKEAGEATAPKLIVSTDAGEITILPDNDTYIHSGNQTTNYGKAEALEIKEQSDNVSSAFGTQTRRAYINFPLTELAGKEITGAKLVFTAKYGEDGSGTLEFHVLSVGNTLWNENSWTWDSTRGLGNTYSWQNSEDGPWWTDPAGCDSEYLNVALRYWYARAMAWEYLKNVDDPECEEYGEKLLVLMNAITKKYDQTASRAGRTIEFGERNNRWVDVLYNFLDTPVLDPDHNPKAAEYFFNIVNYMYGDMQFTRNRGDLGWSNWGAVFLSGMQKAYEFFPEFTDVPAWKTYNESRLLTKFNELYNDDMSFTESGPAYAIWCAELFGDAYRMAVLNDNDLGSNYKAMLTYATRFAIESSYPNGYDTNIGDSNYRPRMDKFITLAKALNDPHINNYISGGADGTEEYLTRFYANANSAYMRNSWDPNEAVYINYTNNPSGGHAHPDLNQVIMYAYGNPLVVDSGRVGYSGSEYYSKVRVAEAHNTVSVNGIEYNGDYHANAKSLSYTVSNNGFDFAAASHSNFASGNINHTRNVLFLHDGFAVVSDYLTGSASRTYNQNWHFLPSNNATNNGNVISTAFSGKANITMASAGAASAVKDGVHSADYGLASKSEFGVFTKSGQNVKFDTILYPTRAGETAKVAAEDLAPNDAAKGAVKFTVDGKESYYYIKNASAADGKFDKYETDAKVAYVSDDTLVMVDGKKVTGGAIAIESGEVLSDISISLDGGVLAINGSNLSVNVDKDSAAAITVDKTVSNVTLNGEDIANYGIDGNTIYAVGVGSVVTVESVEIEAVKDGFINHENKNEGATDRDVIQAAISGWSARNAYMGFDLTGYTADDFDTAVLRMTMVAPGGDADMAAAGNMHLYFLNYNDPAWDRDTLTNFVLDSSKMPTRTSTSASAGFTGYSYRTQGSAANVNAVGADFEVDFTNNLKGYLNTGGNPKFTLAMISESGSRKFASINNDTYSGPTFVLSTKKVEGVTKETTVTVSFVTEDGTKLQAPVTITDGLKAGALYIYENAPEALDGADGTHYILDGQKSNLGAMIVEGKEHELTAVYTKAAEVTVQFTYNGTKVADGDSVYVKPGTSYSFTPDMLYIFGDQAYLTDAERSRLSVKAQQGEDNIIEVVLAKAAISENKITNGDFTDGTTDWTDAATGAQYGGTVSGNYVHGDGQSLTNTASAGGSTVSTLRRFVPVTAGKTYYLSYYAYNTGAALGTGNNGLMSAFVPVKGKVFGSFNGLTFKDYVEYGGQNSWSPESQSEVKRDRMDMPYDSGMNHKEFLITIPEGADNILISMFAWTDPGRLYFSDFVLYEVESEIVEVTVPVKYVNAAGEEILPAKSFTARVGDSYDASSYVINGPICGNKKIRKYDAAATGALTGTVTEGMEIKIVYSEEDYNGILLDLSFDSEETGFAGGLGKAVVQGSVVLEEGVTGKALSLDGTGSNWLSAVMAENDGSLLANMEEITISYYAKINSTEKANWPFFAASGSGAQIYQNEHYLGAIDADSKITIERYSNSGGRDLSNNVEASAPAGKWRLVTVVVKKDKTEIYIDGVKVSEQAANNTLTDVLGSNPVFQIGKANWESGEFYNGLIDEFKIYDRALTAEEIAAMLQPLSFTFENGTAKVENHFGSHTIAIAQYDKDGAMLKVETTGLDELVMTPVEGAATAKAFLWNGLNSGSPLAEAIEVKLQ